MENTLFTDPSLQKKYTVSFINQLQTEWNEFLVEVSHSTPMINVVNHKTVSAHFQNKNVEENPNESLKGLRRSLSENVIVPVPLSVLKLLLSPTEFSKNDASKIKFLHKIQENLRLTNIAYEKLQNVLISKLKLPDEVSDFPSPSICGNDRNSAPSRLCSKRQKKKQAPTRESCTDVKQIKEPIRIASDKKKNHNRASIGRTADKATLVKGKENMLPGKNGSPKEHVNLKSHFQREQQYSSVYDLSASGSSDSSFLFYGQRHTKNSKNLKPTIVCTYFSQVELAKMYEIVKKLGWFEVENTVTSRTTHLICGNFKKTINLCKAVVKGCWILDKNWIIMSAKENRWLFEERFENTDLWPATKENRVKRQKYGQLYKCDVFEKCNTMYVSKLCTQPTANDLKELIILAGGDLTNSSRKASHIVGPVPKGRYLKEIWVLNCILQGTVLDTKKYFKIV